MLKFHKSLIMKRERERERAVRSLGSFLTMLACGLIIFSVFIFLAYNQSQPNKYVGACAVKC